MTDSLNRKEAARYLTSLGFPITAKTLANKAANRNGGKGPPFTQLGWRTVVYSKKDLEEWARKQATRVE